jgi:modification methylase
MLRLEPPVSREKLYRLPAGEIQVGDCRALLATLAPSSVAAIFADPPYNLQLQGSLERPSKPSGSKSSRGKQARGKQAVQLVAGVDQSWDRIGDFDAYDKFTREWLSHARAALAPDGTIWITGTYHNIFRVGAILQELGFWLLNDIIWRKSNPMPNFRGRRFTNAHETIIWASKSRLSRYRFNYSALKSLNGDLQMRSDWTMPICSGSERLRDSAGVKIHPTQKPEALVYRALLASTVPGDLVVDPFFGSGTTGAVATRLGRRFVGIEADRRYAAAAAKRIEACDADNPAFLDRKSASSSACRHSKPTAGLDAADRHVFGNLVEQKILRPGAVLSDKAGRHEAQVRADGRLVARSLDRKPVAIDGSIHLLAGYFSGKAGCDGWDYWHFDSNGRKKPIRVLRGEIDRVGAVCNHANHANNANQNKFSGKKPNSGEKPACQKRGNQ